MTLDKKIRQKTHSITTTVTGTHSIMPSIDSTFTIRTMAAITKSQALLHPAKLPLQVDVHWIVYHSTSATGRQGITHEQIQGVHQILCFSLKCCEFSELCQFCCSAGVWPAIVYTHWQRGETFRVRNIFLKFLKNNIYWTPCSIFLKQELFL